MLCFYGPVKDHIDQACKQLHDNYQCIAQEESCDPWNVAYTQPNGAQWVGGSGQDLDFLASCRNSNPNNDCATFTAKKSIVISENLA